MHVQVNMDLIVQSKVVWAPFSRSSADLHGGSVVKGEYCVRFFYTTDLFEEENNVEEPESELLRNLLVDMTYLGWEAFSR
jgi:hypothetical protein